MQLPRRLDGQQARTSILAGLTNSWLFAMWPYLALSVVIHVFGAYFVLEFTTSETNSNLLKRGCIWLWRGCCGFTVLWCIWQVASKGYWRVVQWAWWYTGCAVIDVSYWIPQALWSVFYYTFTVELPRCLRSATLPHRPVIIGILSVLIGYARAPKRCHEEHRWLFMLGIISVVLIEASFPFLAGDVHSTIFSWLPIIELIGGIVFTLICCVFYNKGFETVVFWLSMGGSCIVCNWYTQTNFWGQLIAYGMSVEMVEAVAGAFIWAIINVLVIGIFSTTIRNNEPRVDSMLRLGRATTVVVVLVTICAIVIASPVVDYKTVRRWIVGSP